jgi:hypothetical protein
LGFGLARARGRRGRRRVERRILLLLLVDVRCM